MLDLPDMHSNAIQMGADMKQFRQLIKKYAMQNQNQTRASQHWFTIL